MSSLRPTPDTGRVPATRQAAQPIGPSWAERQGRAARRAFRQATREGNDARAFEIASRARELGLPEKSTIGSAEQRMKRQRLQPMVDDAISAEQEAATLTGRAVPDETPPAQLEPPTPKPVPGATEPPQNPVSGNRDPESDTAAPSLAPRINKLTGKPFGFDPRDASSAAPEPRDVMSRIRELSSEQGGDLLRGDAVRQASREEVEAGRPPLDYDQTIDRMLTEDRAASRQTSENRRVVRALERGPVLSRDPELERSFVNSQARARVAARETPAAPAPAATVPPVAALPPSPRQNPAVGALSRLAGAVTSRFEGTIRGYADVPSVRGPAINLPDPGALAARAGLAAASAVGSVDDRVASLAARGVSGAAAQARALADPAAQLAAAAATTSESAREANARVARILEEARAKARRTSR